MVSAAVVTTAPCRPVANAVIAAVGNVYVAVSPIVEGIVRLCCSATFKCLYWGQCCTVARWLLENALVSQYLGHKLLFKIFWSSLCLF